MKISRGAVVTGAAGGIGTALCKTLALRGYTVWATDRDATSLLKMASELSKQGLSIHTRVLDVTDEMQVRNFLKEIPEQAHTLSVWINNAGISGVGHFPESTTEILRKVIEVNLTSVIVCSKLVLEVMEQQGEGTIVNMASVAGHVSAPYLAAYSASKHGIVGFTRALEGELKNKASAVKTLLASPGYVDTGMVHNDKKFNFPDWLKFVLASANDVAKEICDAIEKGKREVYPSWNGKMMLLASKMIPGFAQKGSKVMLSRSLKDYLLNRFSA